MDIAGQLEIHARHVSGPQARALGKRHRDEASGSTIVQLFLLLR